MIEGPPDGHVKLSRKAFDPDHGDPFWLEHRTFSRWEAWVDVIQLAAYSATRYSTVRFGVIELARGEFVASLRWLAERFKWSVKSVRTWLTTCEKQARIKAQRETQAGTVYLIVNYDTYQNPQRLRGTAEGTPKGTAGAQHGHKKETSKAITTTALSDAFASNAGGSWVARMADVWHHEVGNLAPGRLGKDAKPFVDQFGAERVHRAMRGYIAVQKSAQKPVKWSWFVDDIRVWLDRTESPIDVIDGEMTPTLELMTRPEARAS